MHPLALCLDINLLRTLEMDWGPVDSHWPSVALLCGHAECIFLRFSP